MGWNPLSWLSARREPDYDALLSSLDSKIKERESRLLSIRLRERRANALFVTYGLGAWVVYLALWWFGVVKGRQGDALERLAVGTPVLGTPVLIIFTRRIMRWFFKRKQDGEETSLRLLKKQQSEKLEELKRKTGYYSTRNLLEKYDEAVRRKAEGGPNGAAGAKRAAGPGPATPAKGQARPGGAPGGPSQTGTPQQQQQMGAAGTPQQQMRGGPLPPLLPPAPSTPQPRTLIDKLADALLGVHGDETTPNSKYALICGKCFAHNGLMTKEEFETMQYICPRCGHFNPPRKPKETASSGTAGGSTSPHRRVQSMHARPSSSDLRAASPLVISSTPSQDQPDPDESDGPASPTEEVLMTELKKEKEREKGLRMRPRRNETETDDRMDTD